MLIEVRPKGLYAEVSVYTDFSVRGIGNYFYDGENLEIEMVFKLPPNAEVTDMWLWVFGIPEQAGMYDRWTASQMYEDIVQRRVDPAILYHYYYHDHVSGQVWNNLYRFQIFPLWHSMPRKTLITYQIPLRPNDAGGYTVPLPMDMASLSDLPIEQFRIHYYPGLEFGNAELAELPGAGFVNEGTHLSMDITGYNDATLNLNIESLRPSIYIGAFSPSGTDTSYVQFSARPSDLVELTSTGKKAVVLFDHVTHEAGHIPAATMLNGFMGSFLPDFTEQDSLNILFSNVVNHWMSNDWMVTDAATVAMISQTLASQALSGYSNLNMLLLDAVQFLSDQGGGGTIVLVSNSTMMSSVAGANSFVQNMAAILNGTNIRIHVVHYDNVNSSNESFWTGSQYLYGNTFAFQGLAALTGGEYITVQQSGIANCFSFAASRIQPSVSISNIHVGRTDGENGISYLVSSPVASLIYGDELIGLAAAVQGTGDVNVSFQIIEANSNTHNVNLTFAENIIYPLDTVADNIWAGLHQRNLYAQPQTEAQILEIIEHSKHFRVLSKYTALLALEPEEGPLPGPGDPDIQTSIKDATTTLAGKHTFKIYPNPFSDILTIDMALDRDMELTMVLYDLHGREVTRVFQGKVNGGRSMHTFDLSTVSPGMYVLQVSDRNGMPLTTLRAVKQ